MMQAKLNRPTDPPVSQMNRWDIRSDRVCRTSARRLAQGASPLRRDPDGMRQPIRSGASPVRPAELRRAESDGFSAARASERVRSFRKPAFSAHGTAVRRPPQAGRDDADCRAREADWPRTCGTAASAGRSGCAVSGLAAALPAAAAAQAG